MRPARQSDRAFGLTFAVLFVFIFALLRFVFGSAALWPLYVAAAFAIVALAAPGALLPLNRLWAVLAGALGHVNNHLLLGLFFYLVMTPFGSVMRLFGWDPMTRRLLRRGSYWTPVGRGTTPTTLRDMF